jgi:hypothetical protein
MKAVNLSSRNLVSLYYSYSGFADDLDLCNCRIPPFTGLILQLILQTKGGAFKKDRNIPQTPAESQITKKN